MVWWPFGAKKAEGSQEAKATAGSTDNGAPMTNYSRGQKILLEDTDPRFNGEISQSERAVSREEASFQRAWGTISRDDFSVAKLTMIPCFRDAGLIGFSCMFVTGAVTFLYHKNPSKSANWSVAGLLLGSIVGWEQCRLRRTKSFQVAQMARNTVAAKERPMMHPVPHDDKVKHQWDGHTSGDQASKPWYRLW